jgi:hypothetical protein
MRYLLTILLLSLIGCKSQQWQCGNHNPSHVIDNQFEATTKYGCKDFTVFSPISVIPEHQPISSEPQRDITKEELDWWMVD